MSDSFIILYSFPSILTSVPDHLPNRTLSPTLTSIGISLPSSVFAPPPTAITLPSCGFSWAESGIIIPDTAQEKPQEGKVVAVGGGAKTEDGKLIPMDVKIGDKVLFGKWSGTEVKIDGKEYRIMKESDIMGISSK